MNGVRMPLPIHLHDIVTPRHMSSGASNVWRRANLERHCWYERHCCFEMGCQLDMHFCFQEALLFWEKPLFRETLLYCVILLFKEAQLFFFCSFYRFHQFAKFAIELWPKSLFTLILLSAFLSPCPTFFFLSLFPWYVFLRLRFFLFRCVLASL